MSHVDTPRTLEAVEDGERPPASDTHAIEDLLIGRLIDERYRIVSRLGIGGMGIVYEARHEVLGSRLAFKVLRKDAAGDEEAVERLKREAQSASAIGNEHIVDVRDFGRLDDGSVYIVMELIEGTDLYTLVKQAAIGWKRAIQISIEICEALFAAHERGIVHRDLKLENVLLTSRRGKGDFVKVVDFGIAKVQGGTKLTVAGRVMGTPEYMSPEQCSGRQVDHRTDIYSLGVMMYEMVTQKLPFWDEDLLTLVRMQMHQAPVPPSSVRSDVEIPLPLEAVILRCLAKDPDARFPTMRSVMHALRAANGDDEALEDTPPGALDEQIARAIGAARSETPPSGAVEVAARATPTQGSVSARRSWTWPAVALVSVLVAGGLGWVFGVDVAAPVEEAEASEPTAAAREPAAEPEPVSAEPAVVEAPTTVEASSEITLITDPAGAQVLSTDESFLGQTPFSLRRPPRGERVELMLRTPGYQPQSIVVSHLTGDELNVVLQRARARRTEPTTGEPQPSPQPLSAPAQAEQPQPQRRGQFLDPWGAQAQ